MINRWQVLALILINVVMLVAGQVLWKTGLSRPPVLNGSAFDSERWITFATSPYLWTGLIVYALATVIWLYVLSQVELSYAYPLQSLAYVLGMVAGIWFFGETVGLTAWVGMAFIVVGVTLLAFS